MATQVGYNLQREDFEIKSIEDIDKLLNDCNIIPAYQQHLVELIHCIGIFETLETDRSPKEIFYDFAAGKRTEINPKRLLDHLKDVKEEINKGIEIYTMLVGQREEVRKYLKNLNATKFKLDITEENTPRTSLVKEVAIPAIVLGSAAVISVVGGGAFLAHHGVITVSSGTLTGVTATAEVETRVGVAVAAVILIIYKIAKYKGKERGLKYQQVKELYDALNDGKFLSTIRAEHETFEKIFDAINKQLHSDEAYMQMTVGVYLEARENSLRELLRAFKKFSSQICISNDSENRIFSICLLYSLGDQLPICILVYFTRTIVVVPTLYFCTSV